MVNRNPTAAGADRKLRQSAMAAKLSERGPVKKTANNGQRRGMPSAMKGVSSPVRARAREMRSKYLDTAVPGCSAGAATDVEVPDALGAIALGISEHRQIEQRDARRSFRSSTRARARLKLIRNEQFSEQYARARQFLDVTAAHCVAHDETSWLDISPRLGAHGRSPICLAATHVLFAS